MYLQKQNIAYCIIDRTNTYSSNWIKSLMVNQADYTVTNIVSKGYEIFWETNEERVLKQVENLGYQYAVVFSTGTEFINGDDFFINIEKQILTEFFIAGHVLDRIDAYYELHHQCYVINLKIYAELGYPAIGNLEPGRQHTEVEPIRSIETFHDAHTPLWISQGTTEKLYQHCCHGWNILRIAFENNLSVQIFDSNVRESKRHFYPENPEEFYKHLPWAYKRQDFCQNEFVHTKSTDTALPKLTNILQVFTPASGTAWIDLISKTEPVSVVFYDYSDKALDYWRLHAPELNNVTYSFVKVNLLHDNISIDQYLNTSIKDTFINLSNVFAYEGTAFFNSLTYRNVREQQLIDNIKQTLPDAVIYQSVTAKTGFDKIPPWHTYDL
jgi:hypothetical protein